MHMIRLYRCNLMKYNTLIYGYQIVCKTEFLLLGPSIIYNYQEG